VLHQTQRCTLELMREQARIRADIAAALQH
jgi:hypothetical protein